MGWKRFCSDSNFRRPFASGSNGLILEIAPKPMAAEVSPNLFVPLVLHRFSKAIDPSLGYSIEFHPSATPQLTLHWARSPVRTTSRPRPADILTLPPSSLYELRVREFHVFYRRFVFFFPTTKIPRPRQTPLPTQETVENTF